MSQTGANELGKQFIGTKKDLNDLGVPHIFFDRILFRVAIGAHNLHTLGRHLHGHVGGKDFGHI